MVNQFNTFLRISYKQSKIIIFYTYRRKINTFVEQYTVFTICSGLMDKRLNSAIKLAIIFRETSFGISWKKG